MARPRKTKDLSKETFEAELAEAEEGLAWWLDPKPLPARLVTHQDIRHMLGGSDGNSQKGMVKRESGNEAVGMPRNGVFRIEVRKGRRGNLQTGHGEYDD